MMVFMRYDVPALLSLILAMTISAMPAQGQAVNTEKPVPQGDVPQPTADEEAIPKKEAPGEAETEATSPQSGQQGVVPARAGPEGILIHMNNLRWIPQAGRFLAVMDLQSTGGKERVFGRKLARETALYLNRLAARGRAAGLSGVLYDNRDRNHSRLAPDIFPQLTPVRYGPELVKRGLDYGLAESILFPAITIGNSSTAITAGRAPRSLPRRAMTSPSGPLRALQNYAANHIYIYPEHHDHDVRDLYPANWPYMLISQGSSGSDQPFLHAVALILASFTPQTRARLEVEHLIAPTVQMVFRRGQTIVRSDESYLSGAAHPTVFDKSAINQTRMMALANSITAETIPPQVILSVESEDFEPEAGVFSLSERLFTTPAAIARIWRGLEWEKEMVISAERTRDPNDHPLTFAWVLLRGSPDKVSIVPFGKNHARARIILNWHEERQIAPNDPRTSNRIDIGVFAHNGTYWSAPAFVSVSFPTHQKRRYEPTPGGGMHLAEIDYDARARNAPFDPVLHWSAPWHDRFTRNGDGTVRMTRQIRGKDELRFIAPGRLENGDAVSYELSPAGELKMIIGGPETK